MRRAFTLIELMIVIAVIAIIAAIAIPAMTASAHGNPHYRYSILRQGGAWYQTNEITRLSDGVRFVDVYGNVVEVHGSYTVYDNQPLAEAPVK